MGAITSTKLIVNLNNGQSVQTQTFSAADLAGLVAAAVDKITSPVDLYTGHPHHIVVAQITDFYETNV